MNFIQISEQMPPAEKLILVAGISSYGTQKILRAIYAPKYTVIASSDDDYDEYDEETDEYYLKEGFYEMNEFEETHWRIDFDILYWMPLPEYPKQMSAPTRIQRSRRKGYRMPENSKSICRPGAWGNPFVVTQTDKNYFRVFIRMKGISPGDCATLSRILTQNGPAGFVTKQEASGHAAKLFGKLMEAMPANYQLSDFDGVDYIACFCKEGEPCHGDVIIEAYNKYHEK